MGLFPRLLELTLLFNFIFYGLLLELVVPDGFR